MSKRLPKKPAGRPKDGWLGIMLYLAGDNNLTEDMVLALQDITKVERLPYSGDVVVAQFDPQGDGLATARFDLSKNPNLEPGQVAQLDDFRETDLPDQSTGSVFTLVDFINWAVDTHASGKENALSPHPVRAR